jgi:hypothetical protein
MRYNNFKVGDKVIALESGTVEDEFCYDRGIIKGEIYTITSIGDNGRWLRFFNGTNGKSSTQFKPVKKEVEVYGIVKFLKEHQNVI